MATTSSAPTPNGTATYLPLPDAAQRLGLSQSALRRRLRAGKLHGERRPTSSGFMWWVAVGAGAPTADYGTPTATPGRTPTAHQDGPGPTTLAVQAARAAEMATYSRELLAPVLARLEEQAERIGHLEADNAHLRARVAELEASADPLAQNGAAPEGGGRRPRWWRRLWWGVS